MLITFDSHSTARLISNIVMSGASDASGASIKPDSIAAWSIVDPVVGDQGAFLRCGWYLNSRDISISVERVNVVVSPYR